MRSFWLALIYVVAFCLCLHSARAISDPKLFPQAQRANFPAVEIHKTRQSTSDLEVTGEIKGLSPGESAYITRDELLQLPQVSYTVTGDENFKGPTTVGGVALGVLAQSLGAAPESDLVIAICDDLYRANYPKDYISAHHPLLFLEVNGFPPEEWPKSIEDNATAMGPYMISHPNFAPAFKVLSANEEAQIPWGVVRIEFRDAATVFGAIAPHGSHAQDADVQAGFRIAKQNCFRCHNMGPEGGKKSGAPWIALSQVAIASPDLFGNYVRNPATVFPKAQMPGNPNFDDATVKAITAYFQTFSSTNTK